MIRDVRMAPLVQGIPRDLYLCRYPVPVFCFANPPLFFAWESKMRSYRSSVNAVSSVSPVNYHVVQLFLFPTKGSEGVFFSSFLKVVLSAI